MRLDPLLTASPITGAIRPITDDLLADVYLAPRVEVDVAAALSKRTAPWSASFAAAPKDTAAAVANGLERLARATPSLDPTAVKTDGLPTGRACDHLMALLDLWRDLGAPSSRLAVWSHVLNSSGTEALEPLPVLEAAPCAFADPAERALHMALADHHGTSDPTVFEGWSARRAPSEATASGAAGHLQTVLGQSPDAAEIDATVEAFGLRDPYEEAQFAAARAQALLDAGVVDTPQEIGVLIPDDPGFSAALAEAFERVGLPLSGQPAGVPSRDIVGELLSLVLQMLERPAPRTALASFCVLPGMPWSREVGRCMAREIMVRGWSKTAQDLSGAGGDLMRALRPVSTPEQLLARLSVIAKAVPGADLHSRIAVLRAPAEQLDWPILHMAAAPRMVYAEGHDRFVEGVTYLTEQALPWRPVRQLIVAGLMGWRYPRPPGNDPFFTESEIAAINAATSLDLPGRQWQLTRGLALFRRQLCAATEGLTLLAAARDMLGDAQSISTGFALIAHALGTQPEALLQDVRSEVPDAWPVHAHHPALVERGGAPERPETDLLHLDTDLLRVREDAEGSRARQSPSRLETLLVSPLAWFLDEIDAGDRTWLPESLDVMTLGNILHRVVELVFPEGTHRPDPSAVQDAVLTALEAALDRYARWLAVPAWETERASLLREARDVCEAWAEFLTKTDAEVLHNEIPLSGDHGGLLLHGKADCLLRLPDGRILVVDHKRSRAAGRRTRINKGWDLQVALYRAMLERPDAATPLTALVENGADVVTAYHTMLDGTVLADAGAAGLDGVEPATGDLSEHAMAALAERVAEVGGGSLRLNRASDASRLKKDAGITAYALKGNAFVAAFTLPEEAAE